MSQKSYNDGVRDAQAGLRDPIGGFEYSMGHAHEEARLRQEAEERPKRPAPSYELPGCVSAISKWTGVLGFLCGALGGFVIAHSALTLPQSIAFAAFAGLIGLGVGFLLPRVLMVALAIVGEIAFVLAIIGLILLTIGVIILLIYAGVTYLSH